MKILRDSGACGSYILSSVLRFSHKSETGERVLMRGMDLAVLPAPLQKLMLKCDLVQGEVWLVAVCGPILLLYLE